MMASANSPNSPVPEYTLLTPVMIQQGDYSPPPISSENSLTMGNIGAGIGPNPSATDNFHQFQTASNFLPHGASSPLNSFHSINNMDNGIMDPSYSTAPYMMQSRDSEEDAILEDEDRCPATNSDDSRSSCDPFSPRCKIPLPHPYSPFEFWMEPSFIRRRNERERQRVRNVNDGFERLRNHLPLRPKEREKRLSKVETLRLTIKYIKYLQSLLKDDNGQYEEIKENQTRRTSKF